MSRRVFIHGAPGAGKTSTSRYLKLVLNWPLVEADYIRECIAVLARTEEEDPFLYISTKMAWRKFGNFANENVIKGLLASRASMKPFLDTEIGIHENLILEGCFLDPAYTSLGASYLVVTADEAQHRRQFFDSRDQNEENELAFKSSRILQDYFIEEAPKHGVMILQNSDPKVIAQKIKEDQYDEQS